MPARLSSEQRRPCRAAKPDLIGTCGGPRFSTRHRPASSGRLLAVTAGMNHFFIRRELGTLGARARERVHAREDRRKKRSRNAPHEPLPQMPAPPEARSDGLTYPGSGGWPILTIS
jgi:hypothetical protein